MIRSPDEHDGETVPPPLDMRIPTDDELDALCDELMRPGPEVDSVGTTPEQPSRRIDRTQVLPRL